MTTNRIIHSKEEETIQWTDDKGFYGELKIKYNGKGGYTIDAEYIGLDNLYCILKKIKLTCESS